MSEGGVMALLVLLARRVLAAVFGLAGLSKLRDRSGARQMLRDFGVPARLVSPAALLLPLAELAAAMALLPVATAWLGALAVLALLLLFIAGISVNLARGRHPDCHCFGQLASGAVGWRTLARNSGLALAAGFIAIAGHADAGTDLFSWRGGDTMTGWLGLGVAVVSLLISGAVLWVLRQLLAQNGRLLTRLEALEQQLQAGSALPQGVVVPEPALSGAGLPLSTPAPGFQLSGLHGEVLTLASLLAAGKSVLLSFVDPGCGPCNALLPDVARWQRELAGTVSVVVVSRGSVEDNRVKAREHGLTQLLVQQDREVSTAYHAQATPSMVLVRPDGTIGSAVAAGAEQIGALVARTMATPRPQPVLPLLPTGAQAQPCPSCGRVHEPAPSAAPATGPAIGEPAPALTLPDLDGNTVDLADYRGRETVLLFWNPGCGFCQQLLPELKAWEANRPATAPALLLVSSGEREAIRAQGLTWPVLHDPGFSAGPRFGATGTPIAVLVDAAGATAAPPAIGAENVLPLLAEGGRRARTGGSTVGPREPPAEARRPLQQARYGRCWPAAQDRASPTRPSSPSSCR